eukprot:4114552-Pyramimonas_sp.AAC.1
MLLWEVALGGLDRGLARVTDAGRSLTALVLELARVLDLALCDDLGSFAVSAAGELVAWEKSEAAPARS